MSNAESTDVPDPGMARAGAAAAARRRELNISQRRLAADGIINAGALISFEKGRSWPRERTRTKLEEVLRWPPGTIARLRTGESVPSGNMVSSPTEPGGDEVPLIAQALITAATTLRSTTTTLPPVDDPAFTPRVTAILADVRQLEAVAARAARIGRVTPALIGALGAVRGLYDDLMASAARAPQATMGQRLYAARRRANLSVAETANAAGVSEQAVQQAEADDPVTDAEAAAIEALIASIG